MELAENLFSVVGSWDSSSSAVLTIAIRKRRYINYLIII